ncbi:MAG: hypothetical protein FWF88_00045 [Peptococcaceae bacterium]|nr:hypothetical protein [Peptococcaceae bacterium]
MSCCQKGILFSHNHCGFSCCGHEMIQESTREDWHNEIENERRRYGKFWILAAIGFIGLLGLVIVCGSILVKCDKWRDGYDYEEDNDSEGE